MASGTGTYPSTLKTARGVCRPFGATPMTGGVNFAVFSRHAQAVTLLLFREGKDEPFAEIPLDPELHRTGDVWHIFIARLATDILYAYRADGPFAPKKGHRYDPQAILIDPYARALSGGHPWGAAAKGPTHPRRLGRVIVDDFSWGDDRPPRTPLAETILYELHVRGFTRHSSADVAHPGTFLGLCEKIPHLEALGVTAVQIMPALEFNELDHPRRNLTREPLRNYWGYAPLSFFAPKASYASRAGEQVREFKQMVKTFHAAGIEVILDVVYNHTCEGDEQGPTLSFRGLDNAVHYLLDADGRYYNFSGCGNTLACHHPVVRNLIIESLCALVTELHVDGFRFDLASILSRGPQGKVLDDPQLLRDIAEHPILAGTKLIAEPWDAGGLTQIGKFPGWGRWCEFNAWFRDDVRRFLRGDVGSTGAIARRICGSLDLYGGTSRHPYHSINFVTCHDGFTLHDLVSYNRKHNEANGEENKDGWHDNLSWNCGHEGLSDTPHVLALRQQQIRNFLVMLFVSQGVPLLLQGDEFGRTQRGNNNAYCQDNDISWIDWGLARKNAALLRFTSMLIALRKKYFAHGPGEFSQRVSWHRTRLDHPDWSGQQPGLALHLHGVGAEPDVHVIFNNHRDSQLFALPGPSSRPWRRLIDTALPSPNDIVEEHRATPLRPGDCYLASPHSAVVLLR
jgi:glycogen operon protein